MRTKLITILATFFAAGLLCSCYAETRISGDGAQDSGRDPVLDYIPDGTDILQEEDLPPQGSITFVIRNVSSETRYLEWLSGGYGVIEGARTTGGAWDPLLYWSPFCMLGCFAVNPGDSCCIPCPAMIPAVKELNPGGEVRIPWDGQVVYQVDADYCDCSCYWERPPVPMGYRASACAYSAFDCYASPCVPDADSVYWSANVSGTAACFETIFDIPYFEDEVIIELH
jgi:hypothetical protein